MEELYLAGSCKAIGVCNFNERKMQELLSFCRVKPMINQFECHPAFQQRELLQICRDENIQVVSYSPLARKCRDLFDNEILLSIAGTHNKTVSQIILKWNISEGRIPIPASSNMVHVTENIGLDFDLDADEIAMINSLEKGMRIRFDPDKRFAFPYRMAFFAYNLFLNVTTKAK